MKPGLKHLVLAACLVAGGVPAALAQTPPPGCFMAKMQNSSGVFLRISAGLTYQVLPGAGRTAVTQWLPQDKLQICRSGSMYEITNLSRAKPSMVRAIRQNTP